MGSKLFTALVAGAVLAVFPALSGAIAISPPIAVTDPATSVTGTSAVLNGKVTPNDLDAGASYTFSWGTDTQYGNDITDTTAAGTTEQAVSKQIGSLSPGTTYHFKLCATNEPQPPGGTDCGVDRSFTTPEAPVVTTGDATSITKTGATLNGTVDPNGDSTSYTFSYGTSPGTYTGTVSGDAGSGSSPVSVDEPISGLTPRTTYYFKLCATNVVTTSCGVEKSFFAPDQPTPVTGAATNVTTNGATLNGSVNPNGANVTSTFFRYGTTTGYGSQVSAPNPGSGTAPVGVSATLSALQSGTTFHFQLCATNTHGTACGGDLTFKTNALPTAVLTADKTVGTTPLTVAFNGSQSGDSDGTITWTLDFGDGSSTGGAGTPPSTLNHTYTTVRSYTARLTVTDNQGAQTSDTETITVNTNRPPVARLSVNPTSGTTPVDVTFDASASSDPDADTPITSWQIDFGDGTSTGVRTGPPPSSFGHRYVYTGTPPSGQLFTARLRVTDSGGVSSTSDGVASVGVNPPPTISVGDASVPEGQVASFYVTLSAASTRNIIVNYATADGSGRAGTDYTATQGTMTITAGTCGPGTTTCVINVPTTANTTFDGTRTFTVTLTNPDGGVLDKAVGNGSILDDDPQPELVIVKTGRLEGNAGAKVSGPQAWTASGNLTLAESTQWFDRAPFYISTPGSGIVKGPYTFSTGNGNTLRGVQPAGSVQSGQIVFQPKPMIFQVQLCDPVRMAPLPSESPAGREDRCVPIPARAPTTVNYATKDGFQADTHAAVKKGQDYVATSGTLTLAPDGSGTITVPFIGNTTVQPNTRWFFVDLLNPTNAKLRTSFAQASGVIIEDDAPNPPQATTGVTSGLTHNRVSVGGTVNPNGLATTAWVEYGTTNGYGSQTAPTSLPADNVVHSLAFSLTGLTPNTDYHYRVVATHPSDNATGYGLDGVFKTFAPPPPPPPPPPPVPIVGVINAETGSATKIRLHEATISGTVNPGLQDTEVRVEYGEPDSFDFQTEPRVVSAGVGNKPVAFLIKNLDANTLYQYRVVAVHKGDGKNDVGDTKTFRTQKPVPMRVTLVSRNMTVTRSGSVPLRLTCTGTLMAKCRGSVLIELDGRPAGFKAFALRPKKGKRNLVLIKLKRWARALLKSNKRTVFDLTVSYDSTEDVSRILSPRIRVLGARAPTKQAATPKK